MMKFAPLLALIFAMVIAAVPAYPQDGKAGTPARIGRLSPLSAQADAPSMEAFRKALRGYGLVEGQHFVIDARFANGKASDLPRLAEQLVRDRVDIILSGSSAGALAAKRATQTIPIVMVTTGDPVGDGIVTSLARPDGNVTGVTALGQALNAKRLELLKQAIPDISRVAILFNPDSPYTRSFLPEIEGAARSLGLQLRLVEARSPASLEQAFATITAERLGAVLVQPEPLLITHHRSIVEQAARHRLPAVYGQREFVNAGGLLFYGASLADMYVDAAGYVDKILKGAKPAALPIEQPTRLELVINLKTAKALGLTIPQSLLLRASVVIE